MGAAICQRNNVVNLPRLGIFPLALAHFAQGMGGNIAAPDGWPRALVPLLHLWRPLISVVLGGGQPLVIRAVRFIGQG